MDTESLVRRVEQACGELGLDQALCRRIASKACLGSGEDGVRRVSGGSEGELARLREENQRLTADRDRWEKTEREIMSLLGTKNPQKIIHDLRNVLNELSLLQALTSDKV